MASAKSRIVLILLSIALAVSFMPLPSYAIGEDSFSKNGADAQKHDIVSSVPSSEELARAAEGELIVTYKDDPIEINESIDVAKLDNSNLDEVATSDASVQTTLSMLGATDSEVVVDGQDLDESSTCSLLKFQEGTDLQEVSAQLLSSPEIDSVQPNYKYELSSVGSTSYYDKTSTKAAKHPTNDPYSYVDGDKDLNQSYIYTTKVADAWDAGYKTNKRISVAVIDSGPRLDHPDLKSAFDLEHARDCTVSGDGYGVPYVDSPSYWTGRTGYECHGTWVSGVLAATANNGTGIAGTSYNAKVIPIKVTNGQTLYTSTVVRAYAYLDSLIEAGGLKDLKVINLSMGGREVDPAFKYAIDHMAEMHDILTVASAGNYGDSKKVYPADYPNALSVMSVDDDFTRSSFSSYGNKGVSAPGSDITTTIPYSSSWSTTSKGKYERYGISGTSFSAPMVSGVAAMCYAAKPHAKYYEIKHSIISGATSLKSIDGTCAPYLNALQAVKNTISGKGLYEATHESISSAKVASISTKVYNGKRFCPRPKVKLGNKTLKRGVDYSLVYSNNKYPGKATVTIKAKGAYKGSKKITFKIIPKSSKVLSLKRGYKSITVKWKRQKASSSGYQIRYSTSSKTYASKKLKSGRTVTVSGKSKSRATIKNLKSKKKYYVQVRAFKKTGGVKYYSKWSPVRRVATK